MSEETYEYLLGLSYIAKTINSHSHKSNAEKFAFERWVYECNLSDPFSRGIADGMLLAVGQ